MKIIICGNYGAANIGDELILKGILKIFNHSRDLRDSRNRREITVLSTNPSFTRRLHKVNSARVVPAGIKSFIKGLLTFSFLRTLSTIKKCDLFILGGGSLFDDTYPRASFIWGIQALAAYVLKKPLILLANGFGPLNTFTGKLIARLICDYAKLITVRDQGSADLLRKIGVKKKIIIAADPVFSLSKKDLCRAKNNEKKPRKPYVIVTLHQLHSSNKKFVQTLDWIHKKYGLQIKLIQFQRTIKNDGTEAAQFNKKFIQVLPYTDDFCKIYELFENSKAVVGMRLHSIILAILTGKPFIAISSFDKMKNLLAASEFPRKPPGLFLDPADKNFNQKFKETFSDIIENRANRAIKIAQAKAHFQRKLNENKKVLTKAMKSIKFSSYT